MVLDQSLTGDAPGGPSRWSTDRTAQWQPLKPEIVIEVAYDQVTAGRFRHGTKLLRERPDKATRQCRCDQLSPPLTPAQLRQLTAPIGISRVNSSNFQFGHRRASSAAGIAGGHPWCGGLGAAQSMCE